MAEYSDREHFIPIRKTDLVDLLCREPGLTAEQQHHFRQLCRLIEATFHFEYHAKLEELKDAYAIFDPDADTQPLCAPSVEQAEGRVHELFEKFSALLERANFMRLSRADILEALKGSSDWGINLDVDFDVFDRLEVFARGDVLGRRWRRRVRNLYRLEEVEVPIYQRLVVFFRLREHKLIGKHVDTKSVYIKVFKDIPKMDLEMLLPGTRVKLTATDRGKIVLPALSGVALTIWKIIQGAVVLAFAGTLAFLGLVGGTIGYGMRSFYGYLQTKQKYQLNLTQSLYYQNLDNNAGALFRLLNDAEEQECREAMLAYFHLWRAAGDHGVTGPELDDRIEQYLERAAGILVDFEIGDAMDKLKRLQIVEELPEDRVRAVPITDALHALDRAWDNFFQYA